MYSVSQFNHSSLFYVLLVIGLLFFPATTVAFGVFISIFLLLMSIYDCP